ncbi:hypothetical protein [Azotobacter vinelandii]|uniref:hypothetical protein n=1 Tax=Azotobacter vinelandii TaxID=354 RepID=UPI00090EBE45|nr:hypothetical protein [Azotobacter vinelandii]SFY17153.1 hypothetical protein SAMN04244547_04298 [Azotobacter vinelandii]
MSKYEAADKVILGLIKEGVAQYNRLVASTGLDDRLVDRRLQALRKRGLIKFSTKAGWSLAD